MTDNVIPIDRPSHRSVVCDAEDLGSLIRSALRLGGDRPSLVAVFASLSVQEPDWAWLLAQTLAAEHPAHTNRLLCAVAKRVEAAQPELVKAFATLRRELAGATGPTVTP